MSSSVEKFLQRFVNNLFVLDIDHAVCISISAAPEEVPGENSEATDQDQS